MWLWFYKTKKKTDRQLVSVPKCQKNSAKHQSVTALLFSTDIPCEFRLCAIHLQLPSSWHLGKAFVFLDLLLLFDFIIQEIVKRFVTCWECTEHTKLRQNVGKIFCPAVTAMEMLLHSYETTWRLLSKHASMSTSSWNANKKVTFTSFWITNSFIKWEHNSYQFIVHALVLDPYQM